MKRCRVWGMDNGYGLSKDYAVLKPILQSCGWVVERSAPNRPSKERTRLAVHLEHIYPRNLDRADINIAIPNVEWCPPLMVKAMHQCDLVIAKTQTAADTLLALGITPTLTGWTSPDVYDMNVARDHSLCHIAGRSPLKNTGVVLQAMRLLPDLHMTIYRPLALPLKLPNVTHISRNLPPADMQRAINRHTVHVLPSQYEGFGHALNETQCVGATLVTTDHAPMSTFTGAHLCPVTSYRPKDLATLAVVDPEDLAHTIRMAYLAPYEPGKARRQWQYRDDAFNLTMTEILLNL